VEGEIGNLVYIPLLARAIIESPRAMEVVPLTGIAVGDPCTDNDAEATSRDPLWYASKRGLVDEAVYDTLTSQCNASAVINEIVGDYESIDWIPTDLLELATLQLFATGSICQLAWKKFWLSSSNAIAGKWPHRYIDRFNLYGSVATEVDTATECYMNRADVKAALHVNKVLLPDEWKKHAIPSHFHYEKQYKACNRNASPEAISMIDIFRVLAHHLDRIWIFNGDADPCVSFEGTRTAVKRIGLAEVSSYRPWFYQQNAVSTSFQGQAPITFGAEEPSGNAGIQMGGEVVDYEQGLKFLTVHGAGTIVA